jgi:hypothetical protein
MTAVSCMQFSCMVCAIPSTESADGPPAMLAIRCLFQQRGRESVGSREEGQLTVDDNKDHHEDEGIIEEPRSPVRPAL